MGWMAPTYFVPLVCCAIRGCTTRGFLLALGFPMRRNVITHKIYFVTSCDLFHKSKLKLTTKTLDAVFGGILASNYKPRLFSN